MTEDQNNREPQVQHETPAAPTEKDAAELETLPHGDTNNTGRLKKRRTTLLIVGVALLFVAAAVCLLSGLFGIPLGSASNNTLLAYFATRTGNKLSKGQLRIINHSVKIVSSVAESSGVKIKLESAAGDGYDSYYKLDIELPKDVKVREGLSFEKMDLQINDDRVGLGSTGTQLSSHGVQADNHYPVILLIGRGNRNGPRDYSFDNGKIRTLHLENMMDDADGKKNIVIKGQWNFNIIFTDKGETAELITQPVIVSGYDIWTRSPFEAQITSFVLSEYSADCVYSMMPKSSAHTIGIVPKVVLKDGSSYSLVPDGGSGTYFHYTLNVPVPLNEVDYAQLSHDVRVAVNK